MKKCIDCHKKISRNRYTRCKKCNAKYLYKIHKIKLIHNTKENHFKWNKVKHKIYKCKKCGNKISWVNQQKGLKQCKSCASKANSIVKHHINLDRNNNEKSNILVLSNSKHSKLHKRAYIYLVKIGLEKQYIQWFLKTYYNHTLDK